MENNKDKSERLKYLNEEKQKQNERKKFYLQEIEILRKFLFENEKEIKYSGGWIDFHRKSIENHKEKIREVVNLNEKQEQEEKLKFHIEQVENHHKKYIEYHKKEVEFVEKEIQLFEQGIKKCEEQLAFLNEKIEENKIA